jgi:hypothetical protein
MLAPMVPHPARSLRLWLGAVVAVAAMGLVAVPAPAAVTPDFYSVSVNTLFHPDGTLTPNGEAQLSALQATGVTAARIDASYAAVQPLGSGPGFPPHFDVLDRIATSLASHGLRWLPTLGYAPLWDRPDPSTDKTPPSDPAKFAAYAAAVVGRYGPGGTFWAQHPELPVLPMELVEVWNEPNLAAYWRPAPDAARYARLYVTTRSAIKAVAPEVRVVTGGLSPYERPVRFLAAMKRDQPQIMGEMDGVGFHPYAAGAPGVMAQVAALRRGIDRLGGRGVSIAVTEVGWPLPNRSPTRNFALPDATRGGAIGFMADAMGSGNCNVSGMTLFTWTSAMSDPVEQEDWFGIERPDLTPTRAVRAYSAAVGRNQTPGRVAPCGGKARHRLALGLKLKAKQGKKRRCVTASVTYRGLPVNHVRVAMRANRRTTHPLTDDRGQARLCFRGEPKVKARAAVRGWARSAKKRI